jgi:sugar O-acyltransferase (sialic acid O-acetyltransferase NeuD family)
MINIYGKGGHAKMISSVIDNFNLNDSVYFYDDLDYHNAKTLPWFIGIGDNKSRKRVAESLAHAKFININVGTYVSSDVNLGNGIFIAPGSVVQNSVIIGNHVIINTSASVDHDCNIGDYCHIAPNVTLCGGVSVGEGTLIGAGSVVLPGVKLGKNCIIGAGSVVIRNIPSDSKAYGNPAKII